MTVQAHHGSLPVAPFLCVGVTGHRSFEAGVAPRIAERIDAVLDALARAAHLAAGAQTVRLATLSQLAAGTDQMVARLGQARGFAIRAVLPFERTEFERDFDAAERAAFAEMLDAAEWYWTLPGERAAAADAYALAGEAAVAQCNLLLAVWDGAVARGPGGTADVIDHAVRRGIPVIHISADATAPPRLLWSGLMSLPSALLDARTVPRAPVDDALLATLLASLIGPLTGSQEAGYLDLFDREVPPRLRWRMEYPLLLAATGARRLGWRDIVMPDAGTPPPGADASWPIYARADALADYYANLYRSGGVFNFAASAGAVLLALSGLIWPAAKLWLVAAELLLIGGLILNTTIGTRREWHRRWLDYRFLAERLRLMRSLKQLGVATPRRDVAAVIREPRWFDPVVTSLWQHMTPPPSAPDAAAFRALARTAAVEIRGQVAYNQANARRMHLVDHRLHKAGGVLFHLTLLTGLLTLYAVITHAGRLYDSVYLLALLAAALPTVGAATFGLRGQADFAAAAGRSSRTGARLATVADNLESPVISPVEAARTLEDAANTMLEDLSEWQTTYRYRKLAIPA